jgi:hypothetical protein
LKCCPIHNQPMSECPDVKGHSMLLRCPVVGCGWQYSLPPRNQIQLKLAGLDKGKQTRAVHWNEKATEHAIDQLCAILHWPCLKTVHRLKYFTVSCLHCDQAGYGASKGVPDRLIFPPWLPDYLAICIDDKGSKTPFTSPEQADLAAVRHIGIARDSDQAKALVDHVHTTLTPILKGKS